MAEMTHGNAVMKKNRQGYGYNYTDLGATYNYINNELKMEAHPVLEMWQEPLETPLGLMFGFAKTKYRNKGEKDWSEPEAPIPIIVGVEQERVGNDENRKESASNFIRTVLGNPRLSLPRLTDAQSKQFIGVVERNRQQNRNVPSNVQEGRK